MVKTEKDPLKRELKKLDRLPKESPFGDVDIEERPKKKKRKEVILFPEKNNLDSPKKSKLKKATKEVEKMQDKLSNIIKVPKEQLDNFMSIYNKSSSSLSSEFLSSIAPVFLSFEDAMNYSTVALRDGLSYDGEIDLELMPLLEWAARLNTFELYLKQLTSLSEDTKSRLIRLSTSRAVEKAFSSRPNLTGYGNTSNKVAGIVTSLGTTEKERKANSALKTVLKLRKKSDALKKENIPIAGVVRTKGHNRP